MQATLRAPWPSGPTACLSVCAAVKRYASWDGIEIAYREWGEAAVLAPVVVHHGFVADADANWVATGVVNACGRGAQGDRPRRPGSRAIGEAARPGPLRGGPHGPRPRCSARSDRRAAVDLVGYSMGAIVSLIFASRDRRVRRLMIGGVGSGVIECGGVDRRAVSNDAIIEALEARIPRISRSRGRGLPRLGGRPARRPGSARRAGLLDLQGRDRARSHPHPTLILAGDRDPTAYVPDPRRRDPRRRASGHRGQPHRSARRPALQAVDRRVPRLSWERSAARGHDFTPARKPSCPVTRRSATRRRFRAETRPAFARSAQDPQGTARARRRARSRCRP